MTHATDRQIAMDAVAEGYDTLATLATITRNDQWLKGSQPRGNLDRLARQLGYRDALDLRRSVDADRADEAEMWRGVYDVEEW